MTNSLPWPTQRAIREGMPFSAVVDADGVHNPKTGGFYFVQEAIDAGHKSIFVRDGNYPAFEINVPEVTIVGESWDVVVGSVIAQTNHAILISAANCSVSNLQCYTNPGGGNAFDGVNVTSAGTYTLLDRLYISKSDQRGIDASAQHVFVQNCSISTCDDRGIYYDGLYGRISNNTFGSCGGAGIGFDSGIADNSIAIGNFCVSNTGWGLIVDANSNNCIAVGNRLLANTAGNESDSSGTSTMHNETT